MALLSFLNPLPYLEQGANELASTVVNAINSTLSTVTNDATQYVFDPVSQGITSALDTVGNALGSVERTAANGISNTLQTVGNTLAGMESQVVSGFNGVVNSVAGALQVMASDITQAFAAIVSGVGGALNTLGNFIQTGFTDLVHGLETGITAIGTTVLAGIRDIMTPIVSFIEGLPADIAKIAKDVVGGVEALAAKTEAIGKSVASFVETHAAQGYDNFIKNADPKTWLGLRDNWGNTFFDIIGAITGLDISKADPIALTRLAEGFVGEFAMATAVPFDEGLAFMLGRQLPALLDVAMRGSWRDLEQMANGATPNVLIGIGELIEGRFRGNIDKKYYFDQMERHGISDANAKVLYENGETLLGVGQLVDLYYRGIYKNKDDLYADALKVRAGQEQVDALILMRQGLLGMGEQVELWRRQILPEGWADYFDDARKAGMTDARIDAVKKSSYRLPSIFDEQEFIRRKVDDEAFVQKWGLDYGIDAQYYAIARANGYDEATAKRMFRRYWSVPPFFITEGLYRTGKLDEATFKEMLIMEGYTPQWTDKLVAQLQPTLTVGDVKDLYKYQVITADQIPEHLAAIGIMGSLAAQYQELWKASVKLASPLDQTASQADAASVKGETEGLIKTAYQDGVINRTDAHDQLIALGKTEEAATLILGIADYTILQKKVKDTYALVKDEYLGGSISMTDALQKLIQAGASNDQVTLYQDELTKAGKSKPKTPTMAEFGAWFKKGIINAEQLSEGLSLLGYAATWIPYFMIYFGATAADLTAAGINAADYGVQ